MTVERLLAALAPAGARVLDPFVGSGTTLLEAARRGSPAIGFDVNPAAVALARFACLAALPVEERRARVVQPVPDGATIGEAHALALLSHAERSAERVRSRVEALLARLPAEPVDVRAELGDARATGLAEESVDFVLTSPPYINVFNYHQYGRPLTDGFGWPVLAAARSEIGSNRQNRGNRFRTVVQYSIDMALAVAEISRVLRAGGTAVLVVGRESRVLGVPFYNGELLARIVREARCFASLERAERVFVNRFGERIFEDVLVLRGSRAAENGVVELGRAIGIEALRECAPRREIAEAIERAPEIAPSPISAPVA
jgi:SAM-dependent methyltransferase